MKKSKKLRLHRETLYGLAEVRPGQVAGGGRTNEFVTGCACTDTCGTQWGCGGTGGCGSGNCSAISCTCFDPPSYCYC